MCARACARVCVFVLETEGAARRGRRRSQFVAFHVCVCVRVRVSVCVCARLCVRICVGKRGRHGEGDKDDDLSQSMLYVCVLRGVRACMRTRGQHGEEDKDDDVSRILCVCV